jgi:SAM-dependent methyltransferase
MDRFSRLLSMSTRKSRIVEIGAGYSPVAPKAAGWNTHVVDHADRETLRAKYAAANVDCNAIEEVDSIWRDGPLHKAVPASLHGRFDTLIASHVIEHLPDLVGFLGSAARLLTTDGVIAAALPDKRYCFDCFRPATTTGDILEAHAAQRTRHSLRTAWDNTAYAVTMDGQMAWGPWRIGQPRFFDQFAVSARLAAEFQNDASLPYRDYHAWQFTPAIFELVMLELGQLGVIDWRISEITETENLEFFVFLRRGVDDLGNPDALQDRRMRLLRQHLVELQQQIAMSLPEEPLEIHQASGEQTMSAGSSPGMGLNALADLYDTNDGTRKPRSYFDEYQRIFGDRRNANLRILELGVASGGSLRVWRDYLPNATIVGVDVSEPPPRILGQDRIHFVRGSQDDAIVLDRAVAVAGGAFDLIVDDASHIGYLTKRAFCHLFPQWLKPGGYYAIENFGTGMLARYPDGEAYVEPAFDDARPDTMLFKSHQSGTVGLVKQIIDYMMKELMTGNHCVFAIERITFLVNVAFIQKSHGMGESAEGVSPLSAAQPTSMAGQALSAELAAIVAEAKQNSARLAAVEAVLGRVVGAIGPLRSAYRLLRPWRWRRWHRFR